jgi:CheY-like chemotaxis protein
MDNTELMSKVRVIAIVDDHVENRNAATIAVFETLLNVSVLRFESAEEAIAALRSHASLIDLVLTDMEMEDDQAGYRVAHEAWAWNIPATIISGGHKGHGKEYVRLSYPTENFPGDKKDPEVWKLILANVFSGDRINNALFTALHLGKKAKPDYGFAVTLAQVIAAGLHGAC